MFLLDMGFSRNNSLMVYIPLFIALGIAVLFFIINIITRIIQKNFQLSLQNPDRPTSLRDVNYIGQILNLTQEEKNALFDICRDNKCPNFTQLMRNQKKVDTLFKDVLNQTNDEKKKAILYSIRTKIEQDPQNTVFITSSANIQEGQKLIFTDENFDQHTTDVLKNNSDGLVLRVPKNIYGDEIKPNPLSKIFFSFETKNLIAYTFQTRIIRYQNTPEDQMLVSHSNNLEILVRRNQKRVPYNPLCTFSAVKITSGGNGKNAKISYEALKKQYQGNLMDISANGCSLQTQMPISKGQYIYIEFRMDAEAIEKVFGKIVHTSSNTQTKLTILHIEFVKISLETRNKIYKRVYDYV